MAAAQKYYFAPIANGYAREVVAGSVVACKWVKAACQRHLDDLERWRGKDSPYRFDQHAAEVVCTFVALLPHVKGEWARRQERLNLQPWQIFILAVVFGWKRADGRRRFRSAYIECPRKNSKSTLSAGVGLYMLAADGEQGSEVYSAATTRDQAKIVFQIAQTMTRREPGFCSAYGVDANAHNIHCVEAASKFEPLSADAGSLDGLNVHCAIIDELHAHRTRQVWEVLETATASRLQPLLWAITTAGTNRAGICYEQRGYLCKILNATLKAHDGLGYRIEGDALEDEAYFGIVYTIDEDDDWALESSWRKANPNYGISVDPSEIARLANKAMHLASAQPGFLTKHLNVWVNADSSWMDMRAWDRCADRSLTLDRFAGEMCWIGLDLASKRDIAAMAILFTRDGDYFLFCRFWLPEETVSESSNSQYRGWVASGRLIETPGNVIDFGYIEDELKRLARRFQIAQVGYDPFQATQFSTRMIAERLPMVEVRPTVLNFSEPMKELEARALSGKLHHDGDPVLGWMVSNVVCHRDAKDNIFPRKEREDNKIDGVVSSLMALNAAMRLGLPKKSVYSNPTAVI